MLHSLTKLTLQENVNSFGAEVNMQSAGGSAIQPVGQEPKNERENAMASTRTPEGSRDEFILNEFLTITNIIKKVNTDVV